MTARARVALGGAALFGPLLAFPTLVKPQLAILLCVGVVVTVLASRSVAFPLAFWALPSILIAILGTNPFPGNTSELFVVGWLGLGLLLAMVRDETAMPLRLLVSGPMLMTLGLAVLMVARLGASADGEYGSIKLQLFVGVNLTYLVAGILVARTRRDMGLWVGLLIGTAALGSMVLLQSLLSGGSQEVLPGRLALYAQADPIALARGAATGLLLAVFVLLASPVAWRRMAALCAIPILGIAFLGAGSRGPVVGLLAGLFVLLAFSAGDKASRRRLALLAVAIAASAVMISQLVPGQNVARSLGVLVGDKEAGGADVSNGRYDIWHEAWSQFAAHPLGGIGTGGFASVDEIAIYPHNIFLEAAAELGLPGLLLIGGLIALAFASAIRVWRRTDGDDRRQAAMVIAFLSAAVVNAQFSSDFPGNASLWLGAGLALGLMERMGASSTDDPLRKLRTRWRKRGSGPAEPVGALEGPRRMTLPPPTSPLPRRRTPAPGATGGEIISPATGSFLRAEVQVSCRPGGAGWAGGTVTLECSRDGSQWIEIGEAVVEQELEVFVVMPGGGRQSVAVLRSARRAEEMRAALAGEHGVTPQQIEIRPAKRGGWSGRDARQLVWDTREVEDGEYLLRSITSDVTGREAVGPDITVTIDNEAPSVRLDNPRHGAVLMGVVDVAANAQDEGVGVAMVRFEVEAGGDGWTEIASVTSSPFRTNWNTGLLGEGDYQLRAIAFDRAGNETISKTMPVRVERVVAAVKLEDPGECLSRTVRLAATVRDEKTIEGVEFQIAAAETFAWQALGAVSQPPFALDLDTGRLEDGVYDLRVVARDRRGGIDASRILRGRRIDNLAPTVSMLEPAAGALLRAEVPLSAHATDSGSGITSVLFQFSGDGQTWRPVVARGETSGAVYWDTARVADGDYELRAVVGDGAGNLTTSDPIAVRVDNTPPSVVLDEPADRTYLGGTVRLAATADDPGSGVIGLRFEWSHDGVAWGELATSTVPPHGVAWDTTRVADGIYRIRVCARDRAGNTAFSEAVELTVRNTLEFEPIVREEPVALSAPEPEPEPVAEPEPERLPSIGGITLWQLEALLESRGASLPQREELGELLYAIRPYARPDGTIPERFLPLLESAFGELLSGS